MALPSPRGKAANTGFGPGALYWAPLGTAEPTTLTGAWPTGWTYVGYTNQGSEVRTSPTVVDLDVDEEKEPVAVDTTKVTREVMFSMAETTLTNKALAENADPATSVVTSNPGFDTFEPPDIGDEVAGFMLGWDSEDLKHRIVWRQCKQVGQMTDTHRKGQLQGYNATFRAFKPETGLKTYKEFRAKAA
jgi:hypothetical protein